MFTLKPDPLGGMIIKIILLIIIILPLRLNAQSFGRNKVQYDKFDFKVMEAGNVDLYYYEQLSEAAPDAARMAERWMDRLGEVLNHKIEKRQPLIIYADHPDFQQTNVISGLISQGTGGVTEGMKDRVVLPLTGIYRDNDHVIGHELVHAYQFDIMKRIAGQNFQGSHISLWMIEGMAEYLSIGRTSPATAMFLRDALIYNRLPTIKQVGRDPRYFPYRWGQAIWAYVGGRWGDESIPTMFKDMIRGNPEFAFRAVTGMSIDSLSNQWHEAVRQDYLPDLENRTHPDSVGRPVITGGEGFNLSPSLSPDGRRVAFLSRRNLFSIDLFVADAETGRDVRKLVSSDTDAHFDALRFMDSAGAWSPDGKRLALVVIIDGDNAISILDVESGRVERTFKIDGLPGINQIDWSPDGGTLAVAGVRGGLGDLFLYNLKDNSSRRLTNDRYAEIQPRWSPDGRTIAIVTDRGEGTDFEKLIYGPMKIGLYDLQSGEIRLISLGSATKHISPQFSPDGRTLFFVADPDGVSDIYSYDLDSGSSIRMTRVATGISGLTELSPALTVSRETGKMMFTVFRDTNYYIHTLDPVREAVKSFDPRQADMFENAALPPTGQSREGKVAQYFSRPEQGLPERDEFDQKDYDSSLDLAALGAAGVGVGVGNYGLSLGGGMGMLFTDILGHREMGVSVLANGGVKDIGGQVTYMNRERRLNWGVAAAHIPYRVAIPYFETGTVEVDGEQVQATRYGVIEQRVYQDWAPLLLEYPLSTNRRWEFSGGFVRYAYGREVRSYLDIGGELIDEGRRDLPSPEAINLVETSVAYVGDYSFFGYTSPVNGRRYRFELGYNAGSLDFMNASVDYRHYFFMNPITLAFRGLHYGRYTGDSESGRLYPYFIGQETFVRGYPIGSIEDDPSSATAADPFRQPQINRLIGSRMALVNVELRAPLLGGEQFGLINFPWLPTELVWFFDGGTAWTRDENPKLKWERNSDERIPVFSTGPALRLGVSNYFAVQLYFAKPFQRTAKNWQWGFLIAPGW